MVKKKNKPSNFRGSEDLFWKKVRDGFKKFLKSPFKQQGNTMEENKYLKINKPNIFKSKEKEPSAPKPEGKLSKRMRRMEQSLKELQESMNIVKSRLGL